MARCVMVLGIHRSGTSATAGVLHELGVPMGRVLIPATDANAKGHFEDAEFTALNERALGTWHTPIPNVEPLRPLYEQHLKRRAAGADVFGLKDPRIPMVAEYVWPWLADIEAIEDIRAVVVGRPFLETVQSLRKRDGWSRDRAIQIQSIYQYKLVETVERLRRLGIPMHRIEFADLIADPRGAVDALAAFAFEGLASAPSSEAVAQAAAFIDPALRHNAPGVATGDAA